MSNEQLQMILNALQGLGVEGKSAFIWWLLLDKGLPVVGWLVTFSGLLWAACKALNVISADSHMARLRDEMGIGSPGPLLDCEARSVVDTVRELMRK